MDTVTSSKCARSVVRLIKFGSYRKKALAGFSMHIQAYCSVHFGRGKLVQLSQLCAGDFFDKASRSRHSHSKLTVDWLKQRARH
jgi:hypothetical protein